MAERIGWSLSLPESGKQERIELSKFWKELIREGTWVAPYRNGMELKVTPERMKRWVEKFYEMKRDGVRVPVPYGHTLDPERNAGWLEELEIRGNALYGLLNVPLVEDASKMGETIRDVSICVNPDMRASLSDGRVKQYGEAIEHVALTLKPVVTGQKNFEPEAAAPSMEIWEFEARDVARLDEGLPRVSFKPWDAAAVRRAAKSGRELLPLAPPSIAEALKKKYGEKEIPKDEVKLIHHWNDGTVSAGGVRAALAALSGARGGVELPEGASVEEIKKHLEQHMEEIRKAQERKEASRRTANRTKEHILLDVDALCEALHLSRELIEKDAVGAILNCVMAERREAERLRQEAEAARRKVASLEERIRSLEESRDAERVKALLTRMECAKRSGILTEAARKKMLGDKAEEELPKLSREEIARLEIAMDAIEANGRVVVPLGEVTTRYEIASPLEAERRRRVEEAIKNTPGVPEE